MDQSNFIHNLGTGGLFGLEVLFFSLLQLSFLSIRHLVKKEENPTKAALALGILFGFQAYIFWLGLSGIGEGLRVLIKFWPFLVLLTGLSMIFTYGQSIFTGVEYIDCLLPAVVGIPLSAGMAAGITEVDIGKVFEDLWLIGLLIFLFGLIFRNYFTSN